MGQPPGCESHIGNRRGDLQPLDPKKILGSSIRRLSTDPSSPR